MTTINVVHSSPEMFNMSLFPEPSPASMAYVHNQLSNFSQSLTDVGRRFMENTRYIHDQIQNSEAMRMARAAVRSAKSWFHPNDVRPLETLEELRSAQPLMQRYIMAQPDLRQRYHRQQVDGYADTYVDIEPGLVGKDHYDWRRVMGGAIVEHLDENGEDTWTATMYCDELHPEDRELDFHEKHIIRSAWDLVKMALDSEKDPTDIFAR